MCFYVGSVQQRRSALSRFFRPGGSKHSYVTSGPCKHTLVHQYTEMHLTRSQRPHSHRNAPILSETLKKKNPACKPTQKWVSSEIPHV